MMHRQRGGSSLLREKEEDATNWCKQLISGASRHQYSRHSSTLTKLAEGGDGFIFDPNPDEQNRSIYKIMLKRIRIAPPHTGLGRKPSHPSERRGAGGHAAIEELAGYVLSAIVRRYITRDVDPQRGYFIAGRPVAHRMSPGSGSGDASLTVDMAVKMDMIVGNSLEQYSASWRRAAVQQPAAQQNNVRQWHGIQREVARAAARLHACGVVHRDLKPQNILAASGRQNSVTIIDFDSATFAGPAIGPPTGTPFWASPLQMILPTNMECTPPAQPEHDLYAVALMGLKLCGDAVGVHYEPHAQFESRVDRDARDAMAFYTSLAAAHHDEPSQGGFGFEEGLRLLLCRLFELFEVQPVRLLRFERHLDSDGSGEGGALGTGSWSWTKEDEQTWAGCGPRARPRWLKTEVQGYPNARAPSKLQPVSAGQAAGTVKDTDAREHVRQLISNLRARAKQQGETVEVEHAPLNELSDARRTAFHVLFFRRKTAASEATSLFRTIVSDILSMHATVVDTVRLFVHGFQGSDGSGDGAASDARRAMTSSFGAGAGLGLSSFGRDFVLQPGNEDVAVRLRVAEGLLRGIVDSVDKTSDTPQGPRRAAAAAASASNIAADTHSPGLVDLATLGSETVLHTLGNLAPAIRLRWAVAWLERAAGRWSVAPLGLTDAAYACSEALGNLADIKVEGLDRVVETLDGKLSQLRRLQLQWTDLRAGAAIAACNSAEVALLALRRALLCAKREPVGAIEPLQPFLCHVVPARGNDGTSEHDAEDDETAREADRFEWAKGVLNMMQQHEFHIDFMEDPE